MGRDMRPTGHRIGEPVCLASVGNQHPTEMTSSSRPEPAIVPRGPLVDSRTLPVSARTQPTGTVQSSTAVEPVVAVVQPAGQAVCALAPLVST